MSKPDVAQSGPAERSPFRGRLRALVRPIAESESDGVSHRRIRGEHVAVAYVVAAVGGLIVLRASVDALDFLGVGWILVLVTLPLLPWLVPRLGNFLKAISPYVERLKLGALQLDLRSVQHEPISVPSSGTFADVANDAAALSSGTRISEIVASLRELRRQGGAPVGIIDLKEGGKWRLPNLYFLARLLETEPVVSQLVFTEVRGGSDGYVLGSCLPDELRHQIERTVPSYADASPTLRLPSDVDLADAAQAQQLGDAFERLRVALPPSTGADDDPVHGFVASERIRSLLRGPLNTAVIEAVGETLSAEDVRTVLGSPHRFVPTTMDARLSGLIDREAVALAVARAAVATA